MITQAPKGVKDLFGEEMLIWRRLEDILRETAGVFGFSEIRTPMFEHTELFLRGVGETTDVVQKEMYTFTDKGGRSLSLRPEGTAGVVRAYVEHGMHVHTQPTKLFYIGPNFRYENPQAGRWRQHHQFGVEMFGAPGTAAEAEVISLGYTLLKRLNIQDTTLHINSIGCPDCRADYHKRLRDFLGENLDGLCVTCRNRFEKNPLRVLDCKVSGCKEILLNAPSVLDSLDSECAAHFESLQTLLNAMDIPFIVDHKVVRGLDYYTRTVFEFINDGLTVIAGGRYDGLIEEVGGSATPAIGYGMGLERLMLLLKKQNKADSLADKPEPVLFIGHRGSEGFALAQRLTFVLRQAGVRVENDLMDRSVKAQMKYAGKLSVRQAVIIGDDELAKGQAAMKDMQTGETRPVPLDNPTELIGILKDN